MFLGLPLYWYSTSPSVIIPLLNVLQAPSALAGAPPCSLSGLAPTTSMTLFLVQFRDVLVTVSVGSGRLDQKGHREPSRDIGHNSVADTVAGEYDRPDSFLLGSRWVNPRGERGKPIGANDGMNSIEEGNGQSYNPA
ncbi:hypothetical protein C8R44DRAFT_741186 [Mycena epipterygia]|nr:hypothetical protein C8R44DRAFT_741186 [Mycena epipterygia]